MKRLTTILFFILLAELALGGGGRLTALGPISLRMILFGLALILSAFQFPLEKKLPRDYFILLILFSALTLMSLIRGIALGATRVYWWEDVKPLLYFLILPFFYYAVADYKTIGNIASLLKLNGVFQSVIFFLLLALIHSGALPFLTFYHSIKDTEEFFFRGEITFTYKGFLFLCVAFLFLHFTGGKYKSLWMGLVIIAIIFSGTRGFWFALLITYSIYSFPISKFKSAVFALFALLIVLMGQTIISKTSEMVDKAQSLHANTDRPLNSTLLGDRSYSDAGRFQQVKEVGEQITFSSIFIGHGFGNGTQSRPIHMEISYLEIFHKQGLLGFIPWFYLLFLLFKKYNKLPQSGLGNAFYFSSLFISIQSFTNQYINNPIGLSMALLSLVCLDKLNDPVSPALHSEPVKSLDFL